MINSYTPNSYNPSFNDILDANLLKLRYEEYVSSLKKSNTKELMMTVKDFLSFVRNLRSSVSSSWLAKNLYDQEKIGRKIYFVLKVRYVILFLYRKIVEGLIVKLLSLIKSLLSQISLT
ncbi:MAG: hypothetical protein QXX67_08155 [Metallosphaera sp.]